MNLKEMIFGTGLKAIADASPEDRALLAKEFSIETAPVVVDAKPKDETKPAMDAAAKGAHHTALHAVLDRAIEARGNKDHMGVDGFGKPKHLDELKKELMGFLDEGEEKGQGDAEVEKLEEEEKPQGDGELEQEEKTAAMEGEETHAAADGGHAEKQIDNHGYSVLKAANDSVRSFITSSRPLVAAIVNKPVSKRTTFEQTMVDSYNGAVRSINAAKGRPYAVLATSKIPSGIPAAAADSAVTKTEEPCGCFDGVPYRIGLQKHQAHLAQKGNK